VSVNSRIVAYHIGRLRDRNPDVRLKSVHELKLLADPAALDALQALYRDDPVLEVRRAAQEAGRVIFLKQQANRP
jgi:hypothetical protein